MLPEKKALSLEEIEAQAALELPDRELMLVISSKANQAQNAAGLVAANVAVGNVDVAVCGINVSVLGNGAASC